MQYTGIKALFLWPLFGLCLDGLTGALNVATETFCRFAGGEAQNGDDCECSFQHFHVPFIVASDERAAYQ